MQSHTPTSPLILLTGPEIHTKDLTSLNTLLNTEPVARFYFKGPF